MVTPDEILECASSGQARYPAPGLHPRAPSRFERTRTPPVRDACERGEAQRARVSRATSSAAARHDFLDSPRRGRRNAPSHQPCDRDLFARECRRGKRTKSATRVRTDDGWMTDEENERAFTEHSNLSRPVVHDVPLSPHPGRHERGPVRVALGGRERRLRLAQRVVVCPEP